MAIALVYSSATGANNPTSGNFPLGTEGVDWNPGDVAVFWWYGRSIGKTWTDASGGLLTVLHAISGTAGCLTIAYRVLQTGDVAVNLDWTSANVANATVAYGTAVFSGVNPTTPIDADTTPVPNTDQQNPNPPATTVVSDEATVVTVFGKNNDYGGSITPPTNYTVGGSAESTAGDDASGGLAYRHNLGPGSEDPGAWTLGGAATDDNRCWTGALRSIKRLEVDPGTYAVTGTVASPLYARIFVAEGGSYGLTGAVATLSRGFGVVADPGSYALTGTVAGLLAGHRLDAVNSAYSVTGTAAGVLVGHLLGAGGGSYALIGTAVDFAVTSGLVLIAESGAYVVTGADITPLRTYLLVAVTGAYDVTGPVTTTLRLNRAVVAEGGAYTLTGPDTTALKVSFRLPIDSGAYGVTGSLATLVKGYTVLANAGLYLVAGAEAPGTGLIRRARITADSGAYHLTGTVAQLIWSGSVNQILYIASAEIVSRWTVSQDVGPRWVLSMKVGT